MEEGRGCRLRCNQCAPTAAGDSPLPPAAGPLTPAARPAPCTTALQLFRGPQPAGQPTCAAKYLGIAAVGTAGGATFVLLPGAPAPAGCLGGREDACLQSCRVQTRGGHRAMLCLRPRQPAALPPSAPSLPPCRGSRLLEVRDRALQTHRDAVTALALGRHGGTQASLGGGRLSWAVVPAGRPSFSWRSPAPQADRVSWSRPCLSGRRCC